MSLRHSSTTWSVNTCLPRSKGSPVPELSSTSAANGCFEFLCWIGNQLYYLSLFPSTSKLLSDIGSDHMHKTYSGLWAEEGMPRNRRPRRQRKLTRRGGVSATRRAFPARSSTPTRTALATTTKRRCGFSSDFLSHLPADTPKLASGFDIWSGASLVWLLTAPSQDGGYSTVRRYGLQSVRCGYPKPGAYLMCLWSRAVVNPAVKGSCQDATPWDAATSFRFL